MTWGDLAILAENPKKIKCVVCEMVGELGDLATLVKKRKNVKAFQRKKNVCESQTEGDLGDLAVLVKLYSLDPVGGVCVKWRVTWVT